MWLSWNEGNQLKAEYGLFELSRFRLIEAEWSSNNLPKDASLKEHPFCSELESTLNALAGGRLARQLRRFKGVNTLRYGWANDNLELREDPVENLVYYNCPRGDVFMGRYGNSLYAYSFPCYGVMPLKGKQGMVPVFYSQSQLEEISNIKTDKFVFFRNRLIGPLRKATTNAIFDALKG